MKASVIIATYGRDSYLVDTIRSVLDQDYPNFELLIVDQSTQHTPDVEEFLKTVTDPRYFYYRITPPSLPAARNFGLAHSTGEIVIYLDDDVLLDRDFIQAHVQAYSQSDDIVAVGGRVRVADQIPTTFLPRVEADGYWAGNFDFEGEGDLMTVIGCNMSFRRRSLEQIGGFDTSFQGNALREETDISCRLRHAGFRLRYAYHAALDHLVAPQGGCREKDLWNSSLYYQNEVLFTFKNRGAWFTWLFVSNAFKNNVWPQKKNLLFFPRFQAHVKGTLRGLWFSYFPVKLHPTTVWSYIPSKQTGAPAIARP